MRHAPQHHLHHSKTDAKISTTQTVMVIVAMLAGFAALAAGFASFTLPSKQGTLSIQSASASVVAPKYILYGASDTELLTGTLTGSDKETITIDALTFFLTSSKKQSVGNPFSAYRVYINNQQAGLTLSYAKETSYATFLPFQNIGITLEPGKKYTFSLRADGPVNDAAFKKTYAGVPLRVGISATNRVYKKEGGYEGVKSSVTASGSAVSGELYLVDSIPVPALNTAMPASSNTVMSTDQKIAHVTVAAQSHSDMPVTIMGLGFTLKAQGLKNTALSTLTTFRLYANGMTLVAEKQMTWADALAKGVIFEDSLLTDKDITTQSSGSYMLTADTAAVASPGASICTGVQPESVWSDSYSIYSNFVNVPKAQCIFY